MFNVYLVDDEPLVLSDMRRNVPWLEYNLNIIGEATSSQTALSEIPSLMPDVVFIDIIMPEMNGLRLAEILREKKVTAEFIVVSAFEKFEYAKSLMQSGGFDYLIKPVNEKDFTKTLNRLYTKLSKTRLSREQPATKSQDLNKMLTYLNATVTKKHSLKALSEQFAISANYICNLFSKYLNTTFSAYLIQIRMETAANLLKSTDKPIKEISADCGYDDYFYFCRVFRNYFACTPTQYREKE